MKRRSFLLSLLAIVMCLSLVLVGCTEKNGGNETETSSNGDENKVTKDPKQVIVDQINSANFENIGDIEDITGMVDFDFDAIIEAVRDLSCETELSITTPDGETMDGIYFGIDDGVLKVAPGDVYVVLAPDGSLVSFTPTADGYEMSGLTAIRDMIAVMNGETVEGEEDVSDAAQSALGMLTSSYDKIFESFKSFKLPEMTVEDLELDGGYYVISDEYITKASKEMYNLVMDMMADIMGEENMPTDDVNEEILGMVDDVVGALGLKLGFEVTGEVVTGMLLSVDVDLEAFEEIVGGSNKEELVEKMAEDDTVCKVELTLDFSDDATALEEFGFLADINIDGFVADVDASIKADGDKVVFALDADVDDVAIGGTLEVAAVKGDEGDIVGFEADLEASVKNVDVGYDYLPLKNSDKYATLDYLGDVAISGSVYLNLANISKADSTLFDAEFKYETVAKSATLTYYNGEKYVDSDDTTLLRDPIDLSEVGSVISGEALITVVETGVIDYEGALTVDGETMSVEGNANFNSADLGTLPELVADAKEEGFADTLVDLADEMSDKYKELMDKDEEKIHDENYRGWVYHDADTGFYVYLTDYDKVFVSDVDPNTMTAKDEGKYIVITDNYLG